jgi:hypothetical protein
MLVASVQVSINELTLFEALIEFLNKCGLNSVKEARLEEALPSQSPLSSPILLSPTHLSLGNHSTVFWYRGRPIQIWCGKIDPYNMAAVTVIQLSTLRLLGGESLLRRLLTEAQEALHRKRSDCVAVYSYTGCLSGRAGLLPVQITTAEAKRTDTRAFWNFALSIRVNRGLILPIGALETILADLRRFRDSRALYEHRGIPYRRGYLLFGPPGNGKTSLIQVVAAELGLDLALLSGKFTADIIRAAPPHAIIVFEDIDRMPKLDQALPQMLNAIDGILTDPGRIFIFTCNDPGKLPPALLRSGRFDFKLEISNPDDDQIVRLFAKFYPDSEGEQRAEFLSTVRSVPRPASCALLQAWLQRARPEDVCSQAQFSEFVDIECKALDPSECRALDPSESRALDHRPERGAAAPVSPVSSAVPVFSAAHFDTMAMMSGRSTGISMVPPFSFSAANDVEEFDMELFGPADESAEVNIDPALFTSELL